VYRTGLFLSHSSTNMTFWHRAAVLSMIEFDMVLAITSEGHYAWDGVGVAG